MNIIITKNNVKIEIQVNNAEETKTLENLINFLLGEKEVKEVPPENNTDRFNVILTQVNPAKKIAAIKALRTAFNYSLKEAKDMIEECERVAVKLNKGAITSEESDQIINFFEIIGAKIYKEKVA
jgi:ribosomal protein L7/L12